MARRNDHTREELISLTLKASMEFLDKHSHHQLSLRKIATMIGYVPSTLVNVFGSYNLLLLHVVAKTLDNLAQESKLAVKQCSDPKKALYKLAYCYHDFALKHPHRWQLIFQHNMHGEPLPEWQSQRINAMTSMLEGLLHLITPHRRDDEIIRSSRVLWAGVHGITLLSVDDKFFSNQSINGKVLIDDLLNSYLAHW